MKPSVKLYQMKPDLLVVGTRHVMSEADKDFYHMLLQDVDYVALEWDYQRNIPDWRKEFIHIDDSLEKPEIRDEHLYLSKFDFFQFQDLYAEMLKRQASKSFEFERYNGQKTVLGISEFQYLQEEADKLNVPCYLVDQLSTITFKKTLESFNSHNLPLWLTSLDLDVAHRNEVMLEKLDEIVGDQNLDGTLIVGTGHLRLYKEQMEGASK